MSNIDALLQTCHYTKLAISASKSLIPLDAVVLGGSELSNSGGQACGDASGYDGCYTDPAGRALYLAATYQF
jgi:hypothetical protein